MRKLAALFIVFAFCAAQVQISARADNDRDKEKGTPPGLAKKGGLPPGQAKKQQSQDETQAAPATSQSAPATSASSTPSTSARPAQPAGPTTAPANTTSSAQPPSVPAEQKETLEGHVRVINDAARGARVKAIAFQQISKETGIPVATLEQQEKNHPGIGMSALLLANLISKQGNVKFRDVVDEREKGRPWAEIAAWHRVSVAPLIQKASDVSSVVKAVQEANRR